ncbi:MAG: sodium/solute symporter [Planctomycetes bacterium]|nr:sodium/solute symporter [Planctomycetota bacterium]MCG2683874.1 sodium/solute symporter [Planctomycetales bacterium]
MSLQISWFDLSLVFVYLIVVVAIGCCAGSVRRRGGEGGHYFLAGNTLGWPVIGLAMFAANISTVHLVSFAETAYKYGLVFGNFEWMAGFVLILLSLFFAPLYLRSRVPTLPDFLERRYNRHCRDWLTVVSIFSALVIHIGVALYTAALVLRGVLGIDPSATILGIDAMMFFIIVLGVLTGIYTMIGGLLAVVWTESIQTVLLLIGAVCVTAVGYYYVGGWSEMAQTLAGSPHPLAEAADPKHCCNWSTANFLTILRGAGDPSKQPWYGILLGYPVIGIWYWCCDQTIVQRVLAARDEKQARLGPLFCAFLKILPVFVFVLPGVMCVAMVQQGSPVFGGNAPKSAADAYSFMLTHMLPWGLKGLVIAAMLAAAMQTCSAALNSTATLFAYDVVKRYRPRTSDHGLVVVGKIATIVGTILAIVSSPIFGQKDTVFQALTDLICYVAPPITAVFLFGVFWKRATGKAAYLAMVLGGAVGIGVFLLELFQTHTGWPRVVEWHSNCTGLTLNSMIASFYIFVLCGAIIVAASLLFPEPLKQEARPLIWEDWREPLRGEAGGRGLGNYRVLSAVVFAAFVTLYILFR